jgi:hypothetical protein
MTKGPPIKIQEPFFLAVPDDSTIEEQKTHSTVEVYRMSSDMKNYTQYSFMIEESLQLGRTGKRLLHGAGAAGATIGIAKFGEVSQILENPIKSALIAGATGVVLTVVADHLILDATEMRKFYAKKISGMDQQLVSEIAVMLSQRKAM